MVVATAWMTPLEEARAVRLAARRAGCHVESLAVRATSKGDRAVGHLLCPEGWAAARVLLGLAVEDAKTAGARDLALVIRKDAPDDESFARAVHAFVKRGVRFVREPGEVFAGASYTLAAGGGDCDDQARVVYAILRAGGVAARLAFLAKSKNAIGPTHVAAQAQIGGAWRWLETTIDAAYDEHPYAAGVRLGVISSRSDIATEIRPMTEKSLPPIPPGFLSREPEASVVRDADRLRDLGYLSGECFPTSADDETFRAAVADFQRDKGLTIDGLPGPETRGALGTIGADVEPKLTKYLSDEFFQGVAAMAKALRAKGARVTGEDFLAIWLSESGVNPARRGNKGPKGERFDLEFGGLNMADAQARRNMGFTGTLDEWIELSDVDQLAFVRRFYEQKPAAQLVDLGSLYLANFMPAYLGHASEPHFVLARKDGLNDAGDSRSPGWYEANAGIDAAKKGWIEVADLPPFAARAQAGERAKWNELRARMGATGEAPSPGATPPSGVPIVAAGLLVLAIGGALTAWHMGWIG